MLNGSIGIRIRECRKAKKWTQEQFAEKVGISVTYLGLIERGLRIPKLETFITIANILDVPSDLLLADLITCNSKETLLSQKISAMTDEEKQKIYEVLDVLIGQK